MFHQATLDRINDSVTQLYYALGIGGFVVLVFVLIVGGVLVHEANKRHDKNHPTAR